MLTDMNSPPSRALRFALVACALLCLHARADGPARPATTATAATTAPAIERPYPGVTYRAEVRKDPAQRLYWATIDLTDPKVSLHVSPAGPDPDGPGKWQTTLMTPSSIARRRVIRNASLSLTLT